MALKAGIVGLPNVGKSTLFNAITSSQVEAANYPFATIEPNIGIVELYDARVDQLAKLVSSSKIIRSTFEFIDIAGLVQGASQGAGLGNKFLSNIREVDAIVEVVRCFENDNVIHVNGHVDPQSDMSIIDTELLLADLETVSNVLNRIAKKALATCNKKLMIEYKIALKVKAHLENECAVRQMHLTDEVARVIKSWNLLTIKPIIYVGNIDEKYITHPQDSPNYQTLLEGAKQAGAKAIAISAQIEEELAQLQDQAAKKMLLDDLGIQATGLSKLTNITFKTLNLATYFTASKKEVRSWTFKKGMLAPQCAGIIHSDFERGFIKAHVISYEDYVTYGGELLAKQAGKNRLEGKNYMVQDGDVVEFKFNV